MLKLRWVLGVVRCVLYKICLHFLTFLLPLEHATSSMTRRARRPPRIAHQPTRMHLGQFRVAFWKFSLNIGFDQ